MKKKIIISSSVISLIFFLAFLYVIVTIERGTVRLDNLITLHQVEILREHLLIESLRSTLVKEYIEELIVEDNDTVFVMLS